ncbi:Crp/Fnr family transcriptional regulator [Methylobacterium durans]|uniref:Crp/Fnr family transcriptional regulator n=1 Tax=Methylobacterium durans TaxID=2202825 RepID=UPI001F32CE20|nr:Crp/Fnr family transcriptional regulator [Methylobacterium durans]
MRRLESIASLADEERRALENLPISAKVIPPHQDIVRGKERTSHCCLVLEGWAYRYKMLHEGRRQILSLHIPGDAPDLHSLYLDEMDHALGALSRVTVGFIPHEAIHNLIRRFPNLVAALWRETLIDAAIFCERITSLGQRDASKRLAHLFCELYLRLRAVGLADGHSYALPVTQLDLSDALGMTNVHVNRVLQELRRRELITLRGGRLTINHWPELVEVAEFDAGYLHLRPRADL